MPYKVIKEDGGFVVKDEKGHQYSKRPLTKKKARKQQVAIALSESRATNKPISALFG
jgi:hypothetical protein